WRILQTARGRCNPREHPLSYALLGKDESRRPHTLEHDISFFRRRSFPHLVDGPSAGSPGANRLGPGGRGRTVVAPARPRDLRAGNSGGSPRFTSATGILSRADGNRLHPQLAGRPVFSRRLQLRRRGWKRGPARARRAPCPDPFLCRRGHQLRRTFWNRPWSYRQRLSRGRRNSEINVKTPDQNPARTAKQARPFLRTGKKYRKNSAPAAQA